ncbi:unnamed protein product [Lupinus luteus]|uniref:Retrotransposon gag domain-containing protein n=1 Tax=Lupinus luteus TaxID=3873 RepID=A0AAV1Y7X4_LUPLU
MPPKTTQKDPKEFVSPLLIEKLRENQELQDARHAKITTVLHNITERLADIRYVPPIPPDPLQGSPTNVFSSHLTHNSQNPSINPPNTPHPPLVYTTPQLCSHSPFPPQPPQPHTRSPPIPPKLQLTPFNGSNPLKWIFQAEQFLQLYMVAPEQRLSMISFYMQGEALNWFKWMCHNFQLSDWSSFTSDLETHFRSSSYINHKAELRV